MSELTQFHVTKLGTLRSERGNFNSQWEEGAALVIPAHRDTFQSSGNSAPATQGQKKTERQYDATAAIALMRFSSVMESLVTPQSSIWSFLTPTDKRLKKNRQVRQYFDDVNDILFQHRYAPKANFVSNMQQAYTGLGAYGNGLLYIDKQEDGKGLRYRSIHLGEAYFVENHARVVDTVYRAFYLTAKEIVSQFGEAAPDSIKAAAASATKCNEKSEILHCVYPRDNFDPVRIDAKGKRYAALYIVISDQTLLEESGYDSFPYAIARYTQAPGEVYGRGPTQFALPSIKTLNQQKHDVLKQGHRVLDPVLLSHDDGNLGSFQMKAGYLNPGGINKDGKRMIDILPTGNLSVGHQMMDIEKAVINDAFLVTLFQILVDTPAMTATEVLERAREKGMLLAPTAGRMQAEFLGPMTERELGLLASMGLLPPVPAMLQGRDIEYTIEYDSPMSRMQRAEKAAGFMRALGVAAEYAKNTGDPSPLDFFNFDTAMPDILDINGAPVAWTNSPEDVQKKRDGRAQQAQTQTMIDAAPAMAAVAKAAPPPQ